ncbi:unnamed protein product [Schistocephalus solidus]|uniref:Uncharacterized protein n=1 Tax=Schistocephalus solidus TaxID=70667 RepID=A0A183SZ85_SCHSO|nr:unnamed protein product [Schistocephalus solidus]
MAKIRYSRYRLDIRLLLWGQHFGPPPEKLTLVTDFARWVARCKDYLQVADAKAQSGAILALLGDEVYDLARSADTSAVSTPSVVLDGLRKILWSSENPWVLQPDFQRRFQQPGESVNDFQQALRLLGRRAFPTLDAKALNIRVLEQFVAGVHDAQIHKTLLLDRPSALALAREEEILQVAFEQPPRSMFDVTAVQPHSSHNASTQTPWQPCSCGSSSRRNNWRRPQTRWPNRPQARRTIQDINLGPGPSDSEYYLVPDTIISCLGSTNCPLVRGTLDNTSLSCLEDSGAGGSLVHQQPFLEFQTKIRYSDRPSVTIHTANGANLRHTGLT